MHHSILYIILGLSLSFTTIACQLERAQILTQPSIQDTPSEQPQTAFMMAPTAVTDLQNAMVVTANPHATQAGIDILKQGGSAIDAAIAVQATLGLVEPQSSGLGGGAFLLTYDSKTGEVWNYDGRETAPKAITPELFYGDDGQPLKFFQAIPSGRSTGAPSVIAMLHLAHQDYGKLKWGEGGHFNPAEALAVNGFHVSPRMHDIIKRMGKFALTQQKTARDYFFLDDGQTALPEGHLLKNPDYAETLQALKSNPRALLEGPIAEAIIETISQPPLPGYLTLEDLSAYQPQKTQPICSSYRQHMICGAAPPSSGGVATQAILGLLAPFNMPALGPSLEGWHIFIEASRLAYADRDQYIADPKFVSVPTSEMLDPDYLEERAKRINVQKAQKHVSAGDPVAYRRGQDATPDSPGTSHFTIIDHDGLVVSMTSSVEAPFGSQRMVGGFMLNNQLTDFSYKTHDKDGHPIANAPAPGKRSRSSMAPTIVFNPEGQFLFTTGSPGGSSIIAYTAKTLMAIIDWNMTPQAAIHLPNVIGRGDKVKLEAKGLVDEQTDEPIRTGPAAEFGMSPDLIMGLEAMGHSVVKSRGEISGLHMIYRLPSGELLGAADSRREGNVAQIFK